MMRTASCCLASALLLLPGLLRAEHLTLRLDRPVRAADLAELERSGLEVLGRAGGVFVLRGERSAGDTVCGARLEALDPRARIEPALRDLDSLELAPLAPLRLRAVSYRSAPAHGLAARLRDLVRPGGRLLLAEDASGRAQLWLDILARDAPEALARLGASRDIAWVERSWPLGYCNEKSSWLMQSGDEQLGHSIWARGLTGTGQVVGVADSGLDADACQFRRGATRDAVTEAVFEPQPPLAACSRPDNKVITYYVLDRADPYDHRSSGFHGTHTTGTLAGDDYAHLATETDPGHDLNDGMAPGAQIVFQDVGDDDGSLAGLDSAPIFDLLKQAYDTGARVHSNSYGRVEVVNYYEADSAAIDEAAWEMNDLLVVFSAGNSGEREKPGTLTGIGATAKNTLVVGASGPVELDFFGTLFELADDLLFFSSQGPTDDGRLKPDIVAVGMVFSADADRDTMIDLGCCDIDGNTRYNSNPDDDNCNVDQDWPTPGTSFSAPMCAGAAALVRQYFTDGFWWRGEREAGRGFNPTSALVKACLLNGATPLGGIVWLHNTELVPPPSPAQGWGRVKLADSLSFPGDARQVLVLDDVPNPAPGNPMLSPEAALHPWPGETQPLATGDQQTYRLPFVGPGSLLKVHLVWADPAAEPGADPALVNDLDLEVLAPDGRRWAGNCGRDEQGLTQPVEGEVKDALDNVEGLAIELDAPCALEVRVRAASTPGNGRQGSQAQGFALLASARFLPPSPSAIEPASLPPGELAEGVTVHGDFFADIDAYELDLGEGIELEGVERIDDQTLRIASVRVAADASCGPRDVRVTLLRKLDGTGQGLLQVECPSSGCGCAAGRGSGAALLALSLLGLACRRKG
ncbi:MAG: S8 family serine peptidase [Deltaproteobacteria bacterium]|nr:S8 family serine peptidase [Deltaproteobacteria bacterium]